MLPAVGNGKGNGLEQWVVPHNGVLGLVEDEILSYRSKI
jgi:hypothetical protein